MGKRILIALLGLVIILLLVLKPTRQPDPAAESPAAGIPDTVLRGVNVDHWLSDELRFGAERYDCEKPSALEIFRMRFGIEEADRLLEIYRENFMAAADVESIRASGFNAVRLPVSASLLYDRPGETTRFARAAARIDWLMNQAAANGLSVVLNIRIRPGEWAAQPPMGGKRFPAVWSGRDVTEVARLWAAMAARFRDAPALVAYDLSPGPCQAEVDWDDALAAWSLAVKSADSKRTIYAPWRRTAVDRFADDPERAGIIMGFAADFLSAGMSAGHTGSEIPATLRQDLQEMDGFWPPRNIPCLVSEFSPMMINPADIRRHGWASMCWTFKGIRWESPTPDPDQRYALKSVAMKPLDLTRASQPEIADSFAAIRAAAFSDDMAIKAALTAKATAANAGLLDGAETEKALSGDVVLDGWKTGNKGSVESDVRAGSNGEISITSSGLGPESVTPEYTFVYRDSGDRVDFCAQIVSAGLASEHAGAGLMLRRSPEEHAPYIVVYRTYDGTVRVVLADETGKTAAQRKLRVEGGGRYLRITTDGNVVKVSCSADGVTWPVAENLTANWLAGGMPVGYVIFSGHEYRTADAVFHEYAASPK